MHQFLQTCSLHEEYADALWNFRAYFSCIVEECLAVGISTPLWLSTPKHIEWDALLKNIMKSFITIGLLIVI